MPEPSPDLARLLSMALAGNVPLFGAPPAELLDPVPHADLKDDTRNVVLTFARIWVTLATGEIRSKDAGRTTLSRRSSRTSTMSWPRSTGSYSTIAASKYRPQPDQGACEREAITVASDSRLEGGRHRRNVNWGKEVRDDCLRRRSQEPARRAGAHV
jgi:hypothetical protein